MASKSSILTRDEFREGVFARDNHKCVICGKDGQDAHHILERRLFDDGGYYLDNGATLCGEHHIQAEQTTLSCEDVRAGAGITNIVLPAHFYPDERYDKWGNVILLNGTRFRGELFDDESVQKILEPVLHLFCKYVKYPRTWHLPWSPGKTKDDRVLQDTRHFVGQRVIVTLKMDGENTSLYSDYMHARSLDSKSDETRHWIKNFHAKMCWNIPENWRFCGENLACTHSIFYGNLDNYFLLFSIWNESNRCLSWDDTVEYAQLTDLNMVPVLYDGVWDESRIRGLYSSEINGEEMEGYVVRLANSFQYSDFSRSVTKYVREGHVQTSHNWRRQQIKMNKMVEK